VGNTSFRPGDGGFRGNRSGQAVSVNAASSRPVPSHMATQAVQAPVAGASSVRSAAPSGPIRLAVRCIGQLVVGVKVRLHRLVVMLY